MSASSLASVTAFAIVLFAVSVLLLWCQKRFSQPAMRLIRHQQPVSVRRKPRHLVYGISMLVLGAGLTGTSQPSQAYSAWSPPDSVITPSRAARIVTAANVAEEILSAPNHPDFLKLRNFLTRQLIDSEQFDQFPQPVLIDLSKHLEKETIKYLIDERPGILSVIYYSRQEGRKTMLVYWPELAGEQVIYTPLSGFSMLPAHVPLTAAQ